MFIVMEVQVFDGGAMSTPCYAYDNRNSAEQKYHSILSSASVSSLPVHSAVMLTDEGYYVKSECYKHEQPEPAPEPEAETPVEEESNA